MNPNILYLAQTDTTVGFVSADKKKLSTAKKREINQPFLICVKTNRKLLELSRVPNKHKKLIRRSQKKSYIYRNNKAIRVVKKSLHVKFLNKFEYMLSTSANKNKLSYNYTYASNCTEIIVEDKRGLFEITGSNIYKLGKIKIHKLR